MKIEIEKLTLKQIVAMLATYGYDRNFLRNSSLDELHTLIEEELAKRNMLK